MWLGHHTMFFFCNINVIINENDTNTLATLIFSNMKWGKDWLFVELFFCLEGLKFCQEQWRVWDFSPYCQTSNVAFHVLMDAGKTHKILGPETKHNMSFTEITVVTVRIFFNDFLDLHRVI